MKIRLSTLALGATSALSMIPTAAMAQSRDTWQAASVASAAVAIFGIAKHDPGLTVLGAAGALYSASRASADCHRPHDWACDQRRVVVVDRPAYYEGWDWAGNHRHDWDDHRWDDRNDRRWDNRDWRGREGRDWNRNNRVEIRRPDYRGRDNGRRDDPFGRH